MSGSNYNIKGVNELFSTISINFFVSTSNIKSIILLNTFNESDFIANKQLSIA